ncbi:MAG: membrane dipeptidase [Myxococcales bacterium]|nr:membrane dipeptidase [Myxococcales bacterium]
MRHSLAAFLLAGCLPARPIGTVPPPSPALKLGVDSHLHLSMSAAAKPIFLGEPGRGALASSPDQLLLNQVDAPSLEAAGVRLILGALWPPFAIRPARSTTQEALHQLEELALFAKRHPRFGIARDAARARQLLARGRIAVLPAIEGGEGIGSLEDLDLYYAAGARALTLVHFTGNRLGGAAHGQLGRVFGGSTEARTPEGLTPLGREVVRRMIKLGVVIDLAHASDRASLDALSIAEAEGVPVINSHTGARALTPMERNISDELAARIAHGGGVVGVTLFRSFVAGVPEGARIPGHQPDTCDDVVAHWLHLARVAGAESLVLGSDLNGFVLRPREGGSCPRGVRSSEDLPELFAALEANGFPRSALDAMGERLLLVLEAVEARADPSVQAAASSRKPTRVDLFDVPI